MKTFTIADIRSWSPCYGPERHLHEDWQGTVIDILNHETIPWEDKLWVVCRTDLLSDKLMRLYAVWCARQVQHLMTDPRSIAAIDVAEACANGNATKDELDAARAAAWDAASDAAGYAARAAAWDAASDAAGYAARAAASDAARDAQKTKLSEMVTAGIETGDVK